MSGASRRPFDIEECTVIQQCLDRHNYFAPAALGHSSSKARLASGSRQFPGYLLHGKEKHGGQRRKGEDLPRRLQTILIRHCQVNDGQVGRKLLDFGHCIIAIRRLATNLPAGTFFEYPAKQKAYRHIVILLARSDCSLSRTTAARLTLLAYLFAEILNFSASSFGFELASSTAFVTPSGMFHAQSPLPARKPKTLKCPSNFRSPSGLASFRIVALNRRLDLRSLPLCPAR
jgi:hypothetical protein